MIRLSEKNEKYVMWEDANGINWKYNIRTNLGSMLKSMYGRMNESSISRIKKHIQHGAIMISAYRGENDTKTNKRLTEQLASDIRAEGYGYIRILGGYVENKDTADEREVVEESFFIPMPNDVDEQDFFDFAIEMCDKYNQDSVLISIPDFIKFGYYDRNGEFSFTPGSEMSFDEKDVQQYFSKLVKGTEPSRMKFSFTDKTNEWLATRTPTSHTQAVQMNAFHENILFR